MTSPTIVVFGDEFGVPLILDSLRGVTGYDVVVFVDSKRQNAVNWVKGNTQVTSYFHPEISERIKCLDWLQRKDVRLGVVASYSRILWPELIDIFPNGVVNLHGGKLPEYRGANVLQWAIINGEQQAGVTLHFIDEGIDTGDIIAQSTVPICFDDTALGVQYKMNIEASSLLNEWVPKLIEQKLPGKRQDEQKAQYWPRRKPDDGRFDWAWSNEDIYNLIRALVSPWPGAFFIDRKGEKVILDCLLSMEKVEFLRSENIL